jgi:glycerol-3-phosphate dehydrogenase subunit B
MTVGRRVIVVGGGIAGCAAALAARDAGAQVMMLSRAPGATALYAGAMAMSAPDGLVPAGERWHPFARLDLGAGELDQAMDAACARLGAALGAAGHPLEGDRGTVGTYLDLHGRERRGQLVPESVAGGELARLRAARVAVVAVAGVGEYDAPAVVEAIGQRAFAVEVDLGLPAGASLTDVFGRPAPVVECDADLVAYPPGFAHLPPGGVELLATMPSPHGLRLQRALERVLDAAGVEVRAIEVGPGAFVAEGDALRAVGGVDADAVVLATGRYIGGGLVKNSVVREPLFDLGVFHDGQRVDRAYPVRLRHLEYVSPEPAFRTGLLTDGALRPLDGEMVVRFANLYAAGSVLGGYDYGGEDGFGVPVLTGWLAGTSAARAAG